MAINWSNVKSSAFGCLIAVAVTELVEGSYYAWRRRQADAEMEVIVRQIFIGPDEMVGEQPETQSVVH